jgi:hypothetical protein
MFRSASESYVPWSRNQIAEIVNIEDFQAVSSRLGLFTGK